MIVTSPGSQETPVLGLWVAGGGSGVPGPPTIAHRLTGSANLGLLLPIVWHPVSCPPVPVVRLHPFIPFSGYSWILPAPVSMSLTEVRTWSDRTPVAGTVVSAGPYSFSLTRLSVLGDRTPSVPWP